MNDWNAQIIAQFRSHGRQGRTVRRQPARNPPHDRRQVGRTTREIPLVALVEGDDFYVFASKGGAPTHPDWYFNLRANPKITVEYGVETFEAIVTELPEAEGQAELRRAGRADAPVRRLHHVSCAPGDPRVPHGSRLTASERPLDASTRLGELCTGPVGVSGVGRSWSRRGRRGRRSRVRSPDSGRARSRPVRHAAFITTTAPSHTSRHGRLHRCPAHERVHARTVRNPSDRRQSFPVHSPISGGRVVLRPCDVHVTRWSNRAAVCSSRSRGVLPGRSGPGRTPRGR